jgi:hypothetical protein
MIASFVCPNLAGDPVLVPSDLPPAEKAARVDFVLIRVAALLDADPALRDPSYPDEVAAGAVPQVRSLLQPEIEAGKAAQVAIKAKLASAPALLDLTKVSKRMKILNKSLGEPADVRNRLVLTILWGCLAADTTLGSPAKADDLFELVTRRLRTVERMVWWVGIAGIRDWKKRSSTVWTDGLERIFEYPRVPTVEFKADCNEQSDRTCKATGPMKGWWHPRGSPNFSGDLALNPTARPAWTGPRGDRGEFAWNSSAGAPDDAIRKIFKSSTDFRKRNLLNCDHVACCLHLEALAEAKAARADTAWITKAESEVEWVWIAPPNPGGGDGGWLTQQGQPYFEHKRVRFRDLQVGDHAIVYNHPAYNAANVGSVWRLENALVVQKQPTLFQGHGILPKSPADMKATMAGLFNTALDGMRKLVIGRTPAGSHADIDVGNQAGTLVWRQSSPPAPSGMPQNPSYAPPANPADLSGWWLRWDFDVDVSPEESAITGDEARRDAVRTYQRIEYVITGTTTQRVGGVPKDFAKGFGFFPLWERGPGSTRPAVKATADMLGPWTWFVPADPKDRDVLWTIRPKVS